MNRLLRLAALLSLSLLPCLAIAGYMNKQVQADFYYPELTRFSRTV